MDGHDAVVHFAAESHVDRSIARPDEFVRTNCDGTNVMCDVARQRRRRALPAHLHRRGLRLDRGGLASPRPTRSAPRSPYSASKAGLRPDRALVPRHLRPAGASSRGRRTTSGRTSSPRRSSRCSSPTCSTGKQVPLYGDGLNVRDWCFVEDNCARRRPRAPQGHVGEIYNIGARQRDHRTASSPTRILAHPRPRRVDDRVRRGPPRPRPPLLDRHRQGRGPRLGAGTRASPRRSRPPSPGTATTAWWWEPLKPGS